VRGDDVSESKTCARCRVILPLDSFPPGKKWDDGLYPYCRPCKRAYAAQWREENREKLRAAERRRYAENPELRESIKERVKARYAQNPEPVKRQATAWALANPERRRQIALESDRRRYAADPEPKREAWRRRHAKKMSVAVVPFTPSQLKAKVAYWGDRCWICGGGYEAIDHVKPLNKGGLHVLANLRPVCTPCNTRKRDQWPYQPKEAI
jgi:5-methylcytosine-specific restriction endonuclease McrA